MHFSQTTGPSQNCLLKIQKKEIIFPNQLNVFRIFHEIRLLESSSTAFSLTCRSWSKRKEFWTNKPLFNVRISRTSLTLDTPHIPILTVPNRLPLLECSNSLNNNLAIHQLIIQLLVSPSINEVFLKAYIIHNPLRVHSHITSQRLGLKKLLPIRRDEVT